MTKRELYQQRGRQKEQREQREKNEVAIDEREYRMELSRIPGLKLQIAQMNYDNSEVRDIQVRMKKFQEIAEIYENAKINAVDINEEDYKDVLEKINYLKFQKEYLEKSGAVFINPKTLEFKEVKPTKSRNVDNGDGR